MSGYDRENEKNPVLPIEHAVANKGPFEMTLEPDSPWTGQMSGYVRI